jgi:hypothetical protein
MTAQELRDRIGIFGEIHANGDKYPKWLHGRITIVERNMMEFTDNKGFIYLFKNCNVKEFRPKAYRRISWKMPKKFLLQENNV